ncbi:Calmodulin-regulated spectrin-associated protein 2 [Trichoplax sp. H2]|nr:Calmodulin-regulated spectrin-associated protein 2 [Trichoplax sp. H2]|eukprot:RDD38387.1 Calmodulin-regulated spectrin-associated protein 2 [Trichoplax sp. H2]
MAQIVSVNQYDPIKAKFYACLRWLATKCSPGLITKDVAASITNLKDFDPNDPATIDLLTSGAIYEDVYANLFEESTPTPPSNGSTTHESVIRKLGKLGHNAEQNPIASISLELLNRRSALHVASHTTLIDAMMDAYVNNIVSVSAFTDSLRRLDGAREHIANESLSNLEEALLTWINLICDLVNESNKDTNIPTIPNMFDLLKDLGSGCCLAAVISYYKPNLIDLADIHHNKPSFEQKLENLSLIRNICLQQLSRKMHFPSIEDIVYGFTMLKSNIVAFLSEFFRLFEYDRNGNRKTHICSSSYSVTSTADSRIPNESHDNSIKSNLLSKVELSDSFSLDDEDAQVELSTKVTDNHLSNPEITNLDDSEVNIISSNSDFITAPQVSENNTDVDETSNNYSAAISKMSKADMIKLNEAQLKMTSIRQAITAQDEELKRQFVTDKENVMQHTFFKILGIKVNTKEEHDEYTGNSKPTGLSFEVNIDDSTTRRVKARPKSLKTQEQNKLSSPAGSPNQMQGDRKGKLNSISPRNQEKVSSSCKTIPSSSHSSKNTTPQGHQAVSAGAGGKRNLASESKARSHSPKPNRDLTHGRKNSPIANKKLDSHRSRTGSGSNRPSKFNPESNKRDVSSGSKIVESKKAEKLENEHKLDEEVSTKKTGVHGNCNNSSCDESKESKGFEFITEDENENKHRMVKFERLRHQKEQEDKAKREAAHQAHEKKIEERRKKIQAHRMEAKGHRDGSQGTSTYTTLSRAAKAMADKKTTSKGHSEASQLPPKNHTRNTSASNRGKVAASPSRNSQRHESDGIGSKIRGSSKAATPGALSAASSRYGSSNSINSLGSESGALPCYVKPSVKSNKKVLINALEYVCLAGTVNKDQREHALSAMEESDASIFMVLFRDQNGSKFRGLYAFFHDIEEAEKIFGTGPRLVLPNMIEKSFKYYTGAKQFREIPSKVLSVSVDAFSIHDSYWLHSKKASNKSR